MAVTVKKIRAATRYVAASTLLKGITRVRRGKGFVYYYHNKPVKAATQLQRIRSLAIPPAWTDVLICPHAFGHLQAIGRDMAGRKQYIYHSSWVNKRSENKFSRLLQFGNSLALLRQRVNSDLRGDDWTADKVIATAIRLMENSHMRIGGLQYEKQHASHGLTTLQNKHAHLEKGKLIVAYTGKKEFSRSIVSPTNR
ncbi:MAG: hypothetical protein NVV59_12460 [Chitinophagaceae bacterium]|nr:hypothetical protein [Chitinophagaceae bacterium]